MKDVELVIKIPGEIRKAIFDGVYCGISDKRVYDAIKNGALLPKGHSFIAICDSDFPITEEVKEKLKDTVFVGNEDCPNCPYCFDITEIIEADKGGE